MESYIVPGVFLMALENVYFADLMMLVEEKNGGERLLAFTQRYLWVTFIDKLHAFIPKETRMPKLMEVGLLPPSVAGAKMLTEVFRLS